MVSSYMYNDLTKMKGSKVYLVVYDGLYNTTEKSIKLKDGILCCIVDFHTANGDISTALVINKGYIKITNYNYTSKTDEGLRIYFNPDEKIIKYCLTSVSSYQQTYGSTVNIIGFIE